MSVSVLMVRHGRTSWNDQRRIQGRTDVPLSAEGEAEVAARRVPGEFVDWVWYTSPLARASRTAELLGAPSPAVDDRLREMGYGEWEGLTREEIRARSPETLAREEARGVDYRPPGGESPREVQARIATWLEDLPAGVSGVIAVTHKGVITAALGLASGWDLTGDRPWRVRWDRAQLFEFDPEAGGLRLDRLNVPLE